MITSLFKRYKSNYLKEVLNSLIRYHIKLYFFNLTKWLLHHDAVAFFDYADHRFALIEHDLVAVIVVVTRDSVGSFFFPGDMNGTAAGDEVARHGRG